MIRPSTCLARKAWASETSREASSPTLAESTALPLVLA